MFRYKIPKTVKNWAIRLTDNKLYLHEMDNKVMPLYKGKDEHGKRPWGNRSSTDIRAINPQNNVNLGQIVGITNLKSLREDKSCVEYTVQIGEQYYSLQWRNRREGANNDVRDFKDFILENIPNIIL